MSSINWENYKSESVLNHEDDHLFKIEVDAHFAEILADYEQVLSEKELVKSKKYNKDVDSRRYITSKYFLRKILSKFIHFAPGAIRFKQTSNKKPSVSGIEFNVTHSGNLVLIAVSKSFIGIDLEYINTSFDFNPLLPNCFHPDEIEFLNANNSRIESFYKLWTRKEALLKATGEGLNDELDQINSLRSEISRHNLNFNLESLILENHYVLSIARTLSFSKMNYWEL